MLAHSLTFHLQLKQIAKQHTGTLISLAALELTTTQMLTITINTATCTLASQTMLGKVE